MLFQARLLQQVRKILWTRKAPACLLILLYAYSKPRLCIKISSLRSTVHRAAASRKGMHATVVTAGHCTHAELREMLWLAVTAVACTPAVYGN